ncbi:hypothetical protein VTJ83DRAFT_4926 [Remersonia thermophila]|uniref:Developmental regulator flbA n=1 Tax=Remersonia thermophila TaxID=72144 RepID=A0ABR4DC98_9PEZI
MAATSKPARSSSTLPEVPANPSPIRETAPSSLSTATRSPSSQTSSTSPSAAPTSASSAISTATATATATTTTTTTAAAASASAAAPVARTPPPSPTSTGPISSHRLSQQHHNHHLSHASISSQRSSGLFAFFDRTLTVRPRQSQSRTSSYGPDAFVPGGQSNPEKGPRSARPLSTSFATAVPPAAGSTIGEGSPQTPTTASPLPGDPPSQPYSETDPSQPEPTRLPRYNNKMHQTSSRLLRMTDDDRPYTKDFKDLFATLIVSLLPLSAHRVRLTKVEYTFLSEDAINNLGSLKFSQSNRMPDPKDPSRIVTTTTTTTFSMAKDMARSICQRFLEARFIESADGKYQQVYAMKGIVWQLTPKGIAILDRFCSRNGIQHKQVGELVSMALPHLVILERDSQTDKLLTDRGTIEVIFRRFIGTNGYNVKPSVGAADSESLSDYRDGLTGVKMAAERKIAGKTYKDTFTGRAAADWLLDCATTVDRRETYEIASLFVEYELMEAVQQDRTYMQQYPASNLFQPTKHAIYQLTAKGRDLVNGSLTRGRASESEGALASNRSGGIPRDSNTQRLDRILNDPALRLLFRENLRDTHCEENLSFYLDVDEFVRHCRQAIRTAQKSPSNASSLDAIKEIMAQAYSIYNAFLAPGSPCELNIDHQLRNNLATRMTKAVGQDVAMIDTLQEVTSLFEDAQNAVFKLMASDSVPKFLRNPKYEGTLKGYDFDANHTSSSQSRAPERSQSRSNRK